MDKLYEGLNESLEGEFRHVALFKLIKRNIKGKKVLDVGCGSGIILKSLITSGYKAVGFDSSKPQYELAKARLKSSNLPTGAVYNVPLEKTAKWENHFDTIICLDVLEHIKNDTQAIKNLVRLAKSGGRIIIAVPALPALWSKRDEAYGHYRRYTKKSLNMLLKSVPITKLKFRYWNFIGLIIAWVIFKLKLDLKADHYAASTKQPFKTINKFIELWLTNFELFNIFPLGLSLFVVAEKDENNPTTN